MQRGTTGELVGRELMSWTVGLIVALTATLAILGVMTILPPSLRRGMEVALALGPWMVIWLLRSVPLFGLLLWSLPALFLIGLVYLTGPPLAFHLVVLLTGLAAALICVSRRAFLRFDTPRAALQGWIVSNTMRGAARRAYNELRRASRPTRDERRAMHKLNDPTTMARGVRAPAERIMRIEARNDEWSQVLRAVAQPGLAYADMLEGVRGLDYDVLDALMRQRNAALDAVLQRDSWAYRWLTFPRSTG